MSAELWVVRHGATEWSVAGKHTSWTDLPLSIVGEEQARSLAARLDHASFDLVLTSPRTRALQTAELAGFAHPEVDADLAEWNYGDYEGITTAEIRLTDPGWTIFDGTTPGGELPADVAARADRILERVTGRTIVFTHGHFGRVLTVRWLGMGPRAGRSFALETATINVLGYERERRVLRRWNA